MKSYRFNLRWHPSSPAPPHLKHALCHATPEAKISSAWYTDFVQEGHLLASVRIIAGVEDFVRDDVCGNSVLVERVTSTKVLQYVIVASAPPRNLFFRKVR